MELFHADPLANLLPYDGTVQYFGRILDQSQAEFYLQQMLENIEWKNDEAFIFGRHYITKRKVAWYGDADYAYTYSNITRQALTWTEDLLFLRNLVESTCSFRFNSCLLNLYHDGDEGMAWHSDDEKSLGENTVIASLSLGAERRFAFRHKQTGETIGTVLEAGSLLIMKDATQTNWLHSLPKSKKVKSPRVNLTFRTIKL